MAKTVNSINRLCKTRKYALESQFHEFSLFLFLLNVTG